MLAKIIKARHTLEPAQVQGQLQFLAELILVNADEKVARLDLGGIDVHIIVRLEISISSDRPEGHRVA
jgi:hypothetical protein